MTHTKATVIAGVSAIGTIAGLYLVVVAVAFTVSKQIRQVEI